jgi:SNF2 family DNA or RNA helicase
MSMAVIRPFRGSLATTFSAAFDARVRDRGERYFSNGAVEIEYAIGDTLEATVTGGEMYDVSISINGETLRAECTCPFVEQGELCKHIYATLLAADRQRFGTELPPPRRIELWSAGPVVTRAPPKPVPLWRRQLLNISFTDPQRRSSAPEHVEHWDITYAIATANPQPALTISITYIRPRPKGGWTKPQPLRIERDDIRRLTRPEDRHLLALLGARETWTYGTPSSRIDYSVMSISSVAYEELLPLLCATGRFVLRSGENASQPLVWDERIWKLVPRFVLDERAAKYSLETDLESDGERVRADDAFIHPAGIAVIGNSIARLDDRGAGDLVTKLRRNGPIHVPLQDGDAFVEALLAMPNGSAVELPANLQWNVVHPEMRPLLRITRGHWENEPLYGELSFQYDDLIVAEIDPRPTIVSGPRRVNARDAARERAATELLQALGCSKRWENWTISPARLLRVIGRLLEEKWQIESDGVRVRRSEKLQMNVSSGIDWFEIHGDVNFEGQRLSIPRILEALQSGAETIRLDDGSTGLIDPSLREHLPLLSLAMRHGDELRFRKSQLPLVEALLAAQPDASADEQVRRAVSRLRTFGGIAPEDPPRTFCGELREYQKQGLGWFSFLEEFSFGGCLADDMGLGKTVQTLALLERRRTSMSDRKPSLAVVPRSLIFNWKEEAARFTPELRILDHTGASRQSGPAHFDNYDLVLTTYGTLRRDAIHLANADFNYVILDEAQAIKNATSQTAKCARLLRSRHRLALSGTPVENHIGELWSLFEFLNPGLLGKSSAFKQLRGNAADEQARAIVARAVRPFILRRTKEQVASELPRKVEQTLWCELDANQRKIYDALRVEVRQSIRARIDQVGVARAKIHVLEALLRLRQAACDPRLLGPVVRGESGAKIDVLLPHLEDIVSEGHKALVFSQFVSMLALVRAELESRKIPFVYLDGKTRDRAAVVDAFQSDPSKPVFLISLKAGGQGLNLTAADYVFLLDPWWNPAVEAQAIDRTHRIGQTRPVFAYRLVARDTVEEKILALQTGKRALADAILTEDKSLIGELKAEDIELLLS